MTKRPAIFLDRDGTLIEEVNYLSRVEDVRLFPFSAEAVRRLKEAGFLIIVMTNQSGIGRGMYTETDMHAIHAAIQEQLGGTVDAFYFCPHVPDDQCPCRKPKLGLIEAAVRDHAVDLSRSWIIGDKDVDVETGKYARTATALVLTGYGQTHQVLLKDKPDVIVGNLGVAAAEIIRRSARPSEI